MYEREITVTGTEGLALVLSKKCEDARSIVMMDRYEARRALWSTLSKA
jgi:threonine dehydrogenase-like Zn-dependent dehydrogenase